MLMPDSLLSSLSKRPRFPKTLKAKELAISGSFPIATGKYAKGIEREARSTMTAPTSLRMKRLCFVTNLSPSSVPGFDVFGILWGNWPSVSIQHIQSSNGSSMSRGTDLSTTLTRQTAETAKLFPGCLPQSVPGTYTTSRARFLQNCTFKAVLL